MILLWSWLSEYVDLSQISPEELGELLTSLGFELESLNKKEDPILTIAVTPNRPDGLSYIGIAREISAKLGRPLRIPHLELSLKDIPYQRLKDDLDQRVFRFCTVEVEGAFGLGKESPAWLKNRLESSGITSIGLGVDITNYVMLESGQPLHGYDRDALSSPKISVGSFSEGSLELLNGQTIAISSQDLVILNHKQVPLGLAGVMGGVRSGLTDKSQNLILEGAAFSPISIRKTAKTHKIHTEASCRFERNGPVVEDIPNVLNRALDLLLQCHKEMGLPAPKVVQWTDSVSSEYLEHSQAARLSIRLSRLRKILNMPFFPQEKMRHHLERLGFKFLDFTEDRFLFSVPKWRKDIHREIDLCEEIARLEGYDHIPLVLPKVDLVPQIKENPLISFSEKIEKTMSIMGFSQVINYPFSSQDFYRSLGVTEHHELDLKIQLKNPLREEESYLNTSLIPGLIKSLLDSRKRGHKGSKIFQMGRGFFDPSDSSKKQSGLLTQKAAQEKTRPKEVSLLACGVDSPYQEKDWQCSEILEPRFHHGKEILDRLALSFGTQCTFVRKDLSEIWPFFHPQASAVIMLKGQSIGQIGLLHPHIAQELDFGLDTKPLFWEIQWESLYILEKEDKKLTIDTSRFPKMHRDLALLIEVQTSFEDIKRYVKEFEKKHLEHIHVFDLYQGDHIPKGKKSMAIRLSFGHSQRTLTDEEVEQELSSLRSWLELKVGAELRS